MSCDEKNGYDSITTWVEKLSRWVHFIPSKGTDTELYVADMFLKNGLKMHEIPDETFSDRDPEFTSKFYDFSDEFVCVQFENIEYSSPSNRRSSLNNESHGRELLTMLLWLSSR